MAMAGVFLLLIQAQEHPTIEVGEDRLLSADGPARPLSESQLSADPNNPQHLLAGVIQFDSPPDRIQSTCVVWATFDGGKRWARHGFPVRACSDPWGLILGDGSAIMVMMGEAGDPKTNVFLFRSADGGRTWPEAPLGLGGYHDHPMVIAQANHVYVVSATSVRTNANQHQSAVSVAHSKDGGETFGPTTMVIASNLGGQATGSTLLSDGTLVVGIHNFKRQSVGSGALRPHTWFLRSLDEGQTFSKPHLISESCESHGGWPSMAADGEDRIFLLCIADKFNGVLVQRSGDQGESRSGPVRVNHSQTADSFTPSIAIGKEGVIGVSWYEIRDKNCFDVYFTASLDSGKTFLPEVRVSSATSCPDTPQNKGVFNPGMTFGAGGDYSGLAASSDGLFHVVWSDARSGIYQLRTAIVTVKH